MSPMQVQPDDLTALVLSVAESCGIPEDVRGMLALVIPALPGDQVADMIADAARAKQLMDDGKEAEASAIIDRYRAMADEYGLGEIFDQVMEQS